ncbi:MAG: FecR domain-containing protein [Bacteroidota bacterium]|jgi:ferric-dicitrate binding protein FerR (iron transport regulator)|nr:FecR domain-containing protein [Bacteroidota bacterium]
MRKRPTNTDFTRFLKDERFIEWKLFPSAELEEYWEDILQRNPEKREDFEQAERYFRDIVQFSLPMLPQEKKLEAMKRLKQSLHARNRRRVLLRAVSVAAAAVALFIVSLFYIQHATDKLGGEPASHDNYIVGNELDSENILFISGSKTATFQGNVDIEMQDDKTARVKSEQAKDTEISMEQHAMNKLIVPYGKRSEIVLADGTRAWLNSGSTLEFPSTFSGDKREVFLTGEMYVEVAPDSKKRFVVHASDYNITVHGTKFNVSAYSGVPSHVVLVEGSVGLQVEEAREVMLSPNEQAIYSATTGTFETREVDVLAFTSWKEGYLTFNDTPVTEVLKQIERYYNLSFNLDDAVTFKGITCTGKIILSKNLDNVMATLSLLSGTEYKRENRAIYIYKK